MQGREGRLCRRPVRPREPQHVGLGATLGDVEKRAG